MCSKEEEEAKACGNTPVESQFDTESEWVDAVDERPIFTPGTAHIK